MYYQTFPQTQPIRSGRGTQWGKLTQQTKAQLNKDINTEINNHKRNKWRETVEKLDRRTDSSRLFKLIKNLNGDVKANCNQAIKFEGRYSTSPKDSANKFNKQFASVKPHVSSRTNRTTTKASKKHKLDNPVQFMMAQTAKAIKKSRASKLLDQTTCQPSTSEHLGPGAKSI